MKKNALCTLIFLLSSFFLFSQAPEEIIFAKHAIDPANPVDLTRTFNGGDAIYAVAFFGNTLQEIAEAEPTSKVQAEVFVYAIRPPLYSYQEPYEEQLVFSNFWISGKALQNKYLVIDLAPIPDATSAYGNEEMCYKKFGQQYDGPVKYAEALSKLKPGDHKLKVIVKCHYKDVAQGEITLTGTDFGFYKKLSQELNLAAGKIALKNEVLPKAEMENEPLKAKMIAALKNSQTFRDRMQGEVLRLVIVDPDWTIRRNELTGIIIHRYIRAAAVIKDKDGNCALYNLISFREDYVGGKFQPIKFDGVSDKIPMDCANVNK